MTRTYTHPSVFEGITSDAPWADPVMNPEEIDWPPRQSLAAIPFQVIDGRPVNPCQKTGIEHGRNMLGHWGEQETADPIVTAAGCLLMIERDDGSWAVPGGYVEAGEAPLRAALRELAEETGLALLTGDPGELHRFREIGGDALTFVHGSVRLLDPLYVDDPRGSDESWMVTYRAVAGLGNVGELPVVNGRDDARRAEWVPAETYAHLCDALAGRYGGTVFAAHTGMLTEFLGGE